MKFVNKRVDVYVDMVTRWNTIELLIKNRADRYILTWKDSQNRLLIEKASGKLMSARWEGSRGPGEKSGGIRKRKIVIRM